MFYIVDKKQNDIIHASTLLEVEEYLTKEAKINTNIKHFTVIEGVKREIHINVSLHLGPSEDMEA